MADNPYYRIQLIRYRLIEAKRLVKALELREQRAFNHFEKLVGSEKEAATKFGMTNYEIRGLRARLKNAMACGLLLLVIGCATKRPVPVPPMPAVMHRSAETMVVSEAVIGPPQPKRIALYWTKNDPDPLTVTEVWQSMNLVTWQHTTNTPAESLILWANQSWLFYKIRNRWPTGEVSEWATN